VRRAARRWARARPRRAPVRRYRYRRVRGHRGLAVAAGTPVPGRPRAEATPRWDAESRAVEVAARDTTRLLVVPENANPGWVATLEGRRLDTRTVDGWQQGYLLPPGPTGVVELAFTPGPLYRAALLGGAAAVGLLLVLLAWPVRREPPPAIGSPLRAGVVTAVGVTAGMLLLVGPLGVLALGGAAYGAGLAGARRSAVLAGTAALGVGTAGAALLWGADPTGSAVTQVACAVAVAAVLAAVLPVPAGVRSGHQVAQGAHQRALQHPVTERGEQQPAARRHHQRGQKPPVNGVHPVTA
jgi:arabinofuranan 3-O-arabinosyltransferase